MLFPCKLQGKLPWKRGCSLTVLRIMSHFKSWISNRYRSEKMPNIDKYRTLPLACERRHISGCRFYYPLCLSRFQAARRFSKRENGEPIKPPNFHTTLIRQKSAISLIDSFAQNLNVVFTNINLVTLLPPASPAKSRRASCHLNRPSLTVIVP